MVEYVQGNLSQSNFASVLVTTPQVCESFSEVLKRQLVSVIDVQKEIDFCQNVGLKIDGLFENMSGYVCPTCAVRCTSSHLFIHRSVRKFLGVAEGSLCANCRKSLT